MKEIKHVTEIIKYGEEGYPEPSDVNVPNLAVSILSDWNRYLKGSVSAEKAMNAGGKAGFEFYIGNESLAKARGEPYKPFESMDDLRKFIKDKLYPDQPDVDETYELISTALSHFNQGGLTTATYRSINANNVNDKNAAILISEPSYRITLMPTTQGVRLIEEDTYTEYYDKSSPPVKHKASDINEEFLAKTITEFLLTNDGHVLLYDCNVLCNSDAMATTCFNVEEERILDRMFSFFGPAKPSQPSQKPEVIELYKPQMSRSAHHRDDDYDESQSNSSLSSN